jgi:hypothetical protein
MNNDSSLDVTFIFEKKLPFAVTIGCAKCILEKSKSMSG